MLNDAAGAPGEKPLLPSYLRWRGLPDLLPRALSAFILMAAALVSVWLGGLVFDLFWLCAAVAVGFEWQIMISAPYLGVRFFCVALGLALSAYFAGDASFGAGVAALGACGLALALAAGPGRRLWAFCGIAYAGLLPVSLGAL